MSSTVARGAGHVAIIGSGNWGSAIARIVATNTADASLGFKREVKMWVYEETLADGPFKGEKLTEVINREHENVKYLPGIKLPENVIAEPDLLKAVDGAQFLVFVIPHQFLPNLLKQMKSVVAKNATAITLIKGIDFDDSGFVLLSQRISTALEIPCCALMGANVADQVARDEPAEATVGSLDPALGATYRVLFDRPNFRVSAVEDATGVELCGALKNVVALAAGFSDGLGYGDNTKAAFIRVGLIEMKRFCQHFFPPINEQTYLESCGLADLITTCYAGRNRKVAEAFARTGKSMEELEKELLNGQKLQGTLTAIEVNTVLAKRDIAENFPLFTTVYRIIADGQPVASIVDALTPIGHGKWAGRQRL